LRLVFACACMHGWQFEVVDMDGRRIDKILLTRVVQRRQAKP